MSGNLRTYAFEFNVSTRTGCACIDNVQGMTGQYNQMISLCLSLPQNYYTETQSMTYETSLVALLHLALDSINVCCIAEPWNWVISWLDMMPLTSIITLLEKNFFPRWLQVLGAWLSQPNPNFYEVTSWYQGWKTIIPEQLLADPVIKGAMIYLKTKFNLP